jgi:hypothetical protein
VSTNYYAIPKVDDEVKKQMKAAIDADDYVKLKELLPDKVHLGKSAGGWNFLFNHNDWRYFSNNEASIQWFLSNCALYDEYNHTVSLNEFWVMVENKKKLKPEMQYGFVQNGLNFSNYTEFS